jgi:hypothetical protein
MKNAFGAQQKMFELFLADPTICSIFEITDPTDMTVVDSKIRRIAADSTLLKTDDITIFPFFDFTFIPMYGATNNFLVYRGTLEFNIYTSELGQAQIIYEAIKKVLDDNYEESSVYYQGQGSSGVENVYKWTFRVKNLTRS